MLVVPEAGLAAFLAEVGEALVPPAREFLMRAGLVADGNRSLTQSVRRRSGCSHAFALSLALGGVCSKACRK